MKKSLIVETVVNAPLGKVWKYWTEPKHIEGWAFASDDWEARDAENDLRQGGRFKTIMAAKDGSTQFDFSGTYTIVKERELIEYNLDDGRNVKVVFENTQEGTRVTETFDPEEENSLDMQKAGWQEILNNFKKYTEEVEK